MANLKYWLAFSKVNFIGNRSINKLWEHFGCIKEAWLANNSDLLQVEGLKYDKIQKFIEARKSINPDQLVENMKKKDIKVLTLEDDDYPFLLKQIFDPPSILFIKGSLEICNLDKTLGVVGSRKASNYATQILEKIIQEMSGYNITLVSGMALGIDACAHKAALNNNIKTIAVLGGGFDYIYPKDNRVIFDKIIDNNGAVISEYYPEEKPDVWKFPYRNRIISGLSKGTLIAEAGLKSGALITAKLCLEQNRELMCIPGLISNPNTEGTHKLIKEGAGLVTNAGDIFEYLGWEWIGNSENHSKNSDKNCKEIKLLDKEKKVYDILSLEPKQFDEILKQSEVSVQELMSVMTIMELNGIIRQLPGQKYVRAL